MLKLRLTFFNTEKKDYGKYVSYRSTTPKAVYELSYNTDNWKRAFAFAERKKRKLQKENSSLGLNTRLEFID